MFLVIPVKNRLGFFCMPEWCKCLLLNWDERCADSRLVSLGRKPNSICA